MPSSLDWVVYDAASGQLINTATNQMATCAHQLWQTHYYYHYHSPADQPALLSVS